MRKLLEIKIEHAYSLTQSSANVFRAKPDALTRMHFDRMGVRYRLQKSGFALYVPQEKEEVYQKYLSEQAPFQLCCELEAIDPYWLNYTELPWSLHQVPSILYFTATKLSRQPIHQVSQQDLLPSSQERAYLSDNLAQEAGVFQKNYSEPKTSHSSLAQIEITSTDLPTMANAALTKGKREPAYLYFQLLFPAREAYWRYWLVPRNPAHFEAIQRIHILSEDAQIRFKEPEPIQMEDGRFAYLVVSEQPLGIYQRSPFRFKALIEKKFEDQNIPLHEKQKPKTCQIKLPAADPKYVRPSSNSPETKMIVDIFGWV